ncbi:MAG: tail fiber domain-containing protein, partial [Candidatus Gastranaerophilales bacterium]|nr:tail fiber domain-containing protein [Candidatus Gastranaerophilales bacterium]
MNKKTKGFTLAELLISLLVVSLVLSAVIPTITRRTQNDREYIWAWANTNNSAYFGVGSNQSAILGLNNIPEKTLDDMLKDTQAISSVSNDTYDASPIGNDYQTEKIITDDLNFAAGDKLVIFKKAIENENNPNVNFLNSHIAFYTIQGNPDATTNDINYAGRLAMDSGNIALGIGTLQNITADHAGENTALGHFALLRDAGGIRNTAVGKKALTHNDNGNYNTAVGFASLYHLSSSSTEDTNNGINTTENTAVGSLAMERVTQGSYNTAVGSQALRYMDGANNLNSSNFNTAIGRGALLLLRQGNSNTALGSHACNKLNNGDDNICIGSYAANDVEQDSYSLYIGTGLTYQEMKYMHENEDVQGNRITLRSGTTPLITGHTRYYNDGTNTYDKELVVNARKVEFKPYNGIRPTFVFHSLYGTADNGYAQASNENGVKGIAVFNLRDTGGGSGDNTSVTMYMDGLVSSYDGKKYARIITYNPYNTTETDDSRLADINLNNYLTIDFPDGQSTDNYKEVGIRTPENFGTTLSLNDKVKIYNTDNTPQIYLGENSFVLSDSSSSSSSNQTDFKINLQNSSTGANLYIDTSKINLQLTGSDNEIKLGSGDNITEITSGTIQVGSGVYIDKDDISLSAISGGNGYGKVAQSINDLYTQLSQIGGTAVSDERLKNISGDNTAGLNEINALEVKNYTYKNDKEKTPHVGVIAQQLQKIFPNSVFEGEDGYLRIKTEEIFYA